MFHITSTIHEMKILTSPKPHSTHVHDFLHPPNYTQHMYMTSTRWRFLHPPNHTQHMYMTSTRWRFLHPPNHTQHMYMTSRWLKLSVGWNNVATHWWFLYTFIVQKQLNTHPLCHQLIFLWHQLIHLPDCVPMKYQQTIDVETAAETETDYQTHCDKQLNMFHSASTYSHRPTYTLNTCTWH